MIGRGCMGYRSIKLGLVGSFLKDNLTRNFDALEDAIPGSSNATHRPVSKVVKIIYIG